MVLTSSFFFFWFTYFCHCLSPPLLLKDDVCTQYPMYSFSFSFPRECLFSSYFTVVLPVFSPSLHILSYCTTVSDLVMYAPHPFDPPCSPMLCTLHNHPLLGAHLASPLASPLSSLSHSLSHFQSHFPARHLAALAAIQVITSSLPCPPPFL